MRTRIPLAVGLALTAMAIAIVLSRPALVVARTNGVPIEGTVRAMTTPGEACQQHELLPRGTTAIRLSLEALFGPTVRIRAMRGRRQLTSGQRLSGWTRQTVTIPVKTVRRTSSQVSICFALAPQDETVDLNGGRSASALVATGGARAGGPAGIDYLPPVARPASAGIRIEYLRPGPRSWWSLAVQVARRMGLGRAPSGTWTVLVVLAAMAALVAVVAWLVVQEPR